jgi:iron complex transport system substrate-binding protein
MNHRLHRLHGLDINHRSNLSRKGKNVTSAKSEIPNKHQISKFQSQNRLTPFVLSIGRFGFGICLLFAILILGFATSICQPGQTSAKVVDLTKSPQRIVSLSPNLTEIVFALGLGDKVVGVSNNCDWPPEAKTKPKVGTFWQPNTEAIIAAKPDLVICESFDQQRTVAETLKRAGLNVFSLRVESIEELFPAISQIGLYADCTDKAKHLAEDIRGRLGQISDRTSSSRKVKVLWIVQPEPVRVAGVKTFINEIIEIAGGKNAISPTKDQYPQVGTEDIISCGAEVIIQSAMGSENIAGQQRAAEESWGKFPNLPAVKNKRIYVIDPDTVLRLGPRLPQGVQTVAKLLHPELFEQPKEPNQVTKRANG